jgi:superfamily II DNA or RNA helicase
MATLTKHQAKYFAHELRRSYANDHVGKLAGLLFDAQVEPKPHQIDAALFALQTPFLRGVIMADEVGLGKTIEAGIVITQYWAERKRSILIVTPSSLRQQWKQELFEKFLIPANVLDTKNKDSLLAIKASGQTEVLICSYEFAQRYESTLLRSWDLVVADEAHRLRNHWTGKGKTAEALSHIFEGSRKCVLLTATPLQNKLEELYGLVSVFDPDYFYSLDAFRERYVKAASLVEGDDLAERVATISKRTLRRDAEKYIHFTKRYPITVEFTPSDDELRLYNLVNEYLQRDELFAFSGSQRHLAALIIRKRLGSSTFAVSSTLERISNRLETEALDGVTRSNSGKIITADFEVEDLTDEELEEAEVSEFGPGGSETAASKSERTRLMLTEVAELREYAALAKSITVNQKAVKLAEALDKGFARLHELGAPEKAIIFTDSTKTQEYIARSLKEAGKGEGIVLFNGSNDGPEQSAIYKAWLAKNRGSDLVTGIASADRRKALVDYFRDQGKIMIATEAAAEGINLQFCSMLVNYDLPWNPQRVEQRIGRIHRYGQNFDVVVANFSNKGNVAEQRILELLTNKFQLFSSVFGASDEVLGAIEDGFDFEKKISEILNSSRTDGEISAAFNELETLFATEISNEMASAKARVFDNLDPDVQDRLKAYDSQSGEVLNKFERLLLDVTKHALVDVATFEGDGRHFVLNAPPVTGVETGRYFFKSQPQDNAHQYRYASPLAQYVLETSISCVTPLAELTFSLSASNRASTAVRALSGLSGTLTVDLVTYSMKAQDEQITESYFLAGAFTSEGKWLDNEYVSEILELTCVDQQMVNHALNLEAFDQPLKDMMSIFENEVQIRNSSYLFQQEDQLQRNMQDRKAEFEGQLRDFRMKEKNARRDSNAASDPMERLRFKKLEANYQRKIIDAEDEFREKRKVIRAEADKYLVLIEQALKGVQQRDHVLTIKWKVVA